MMLGARSVPQRSGNLLRHADAPSIAAEAPGRPTGAEASQRGISTVSRTRVRALTIVTVAVLVVALYCRVALGGLSLTTSRGSTVHFRKMMARGTPVLRSSRKNSYPLVIGG